MQGFLIHVSFDSKSLAATQKIIGTILGPGSEALPAASVGEEPASEAAAKQFPHEPQRTACIYTYMYCIYA